ncbi:hypothetical protein ES706_06601 [subsurface metagenome]
MARKRLIVNVSAETKSFLDSIKRPGQSYDDLIQELVKFWKRPWPASCTLVSTKKGGQNGKSS